MPVWDQSILPFYRDLFLIIDSSTAFSTLLFGLILLGQWYNEEYRRYLDLKLAWSIFFFGLFVNSIAFMISSYWIVNEPLNTQWVALGYISLILSLTVFFFAMERILPYQTYYLFTIIGLCCTVITPLIPRQYYNQFASIPAFIALIGILLFLRFALRITFGDIRKHVEIVVISFLIGWLGFIGRSDYVYYNFGDIFYLGGLFFLLIGITIFGYVLTYSVALDELDWKKQIVGLYLIQKGGLLIFHYAFVETADADKVLNAAGLSGVQSLFQEITRTEKGLNFVSIGEYELLFSHGIDITGVLIALKPYQVLMNKIKEFVIQFHQILGPVMGRFSGPLDDFEPATELAESIFFRREM